MRFHRYMGSSKILAVFIILGLFVSISFAIAFEAKSNNENQVRVDVKPIQLVAGKPAIFKVRLNTHAVNLDYDMVKICVLRDGQGKEYKAVKWKGSPPGGHHRSGILEFSELEGNPQSVRLVIKGMAGVPERSFDWKVEG